MNFIKSRQIWFWFFYVSDRLILVFSFNVKRDYFHGFRNTLDTQRKCHPFSISSYGYAAYIFFVCVSTRAAMNILVSGACIARPTVRYFVPAASYFSHSKVSGPSFSLAILRSCKLMGNVILKWSTEQKQARVHSTSFLSI